MNQWKVRFQKVLRSISLSRTSWGTVERFAMINQGKGWGAATIKAEVSACLSLLPSPPRVFVDIGANKGLYTFEVVSRIPNVQAYLFEPSPANIPFLVDKFSQHRNVHLNFRAISNTRGKKTLFADEPGSGLGSFTKRRLDHFGIEMTHAEDVETLRFDEFWSSLQHSSIDYVKIDVEGHELNVLEGFGNRITDVRLIQFEFGGCNIDTRTFFQDFWYFFNDVHFSLYRITPYGVSKLHAYDERDECFQTTNYIAVNEHLK